MKKRLLVTTLLVATFCSSGYYWAKGPDPFLVSQRVTGDYSNPGYSPAEGDSTGIDNSQGNNADPSLSDNSAQDPSSNPSPVSGDPGLDQNANSPEQAAQPENPNPSSPSPDSTSNSDGTPNSKVVNTVGDKEIDYKSVFRNALFIGDSITEGIAFYDFVSADNVYSRLGLTLRKAYNDLDKIKLSNPSEIYLMFGANDLEENAKDDFYLNNYRQLIAALHSKWPDATIYIQSILPLKQGVEKKYQNLSNARIATINNALEDLGLELEKVYYVDLSSVRQQFTDSIYESDGIHYRKDFYPSWLNYLVTNVKLQTVEE